MRFIIVIMKFILFLLGMANHEDNFGIRNVENLGKRLTTELIPQKIKRIFRDVKGIEYLI